MNTYFMLLAPEIVLLTGALVVLLIGLSARPYVRRTIPWIAVMTAILAITAVWYSVAQNSPLMPKGVNISSLTWFVRQIALAVGLVAMLINTCVPEKEDEGEYYSMILFSLTGVILTASANDLILLFLALELVSIPTYALVSVSGRDPRSQEAGLKYFFLGALAAAIMIYGMSFLYGGLGVTSLSSMKGILSPGNPYVLIGLILVLSGIAFKIAAVPFHLYIPDVYEGAASPLAGLLGFFPKFAGFVALLRILALVPAGDPADRSWVPPDLIFWILWGMAATTMTVGNCLAIFQTNVKRILAYSSIAHSGYVLIAILVGTTSFGTPLRDGWSAALFYLTVYGVMNLGAFGVLACVRIYDKSAETLEDLAGLARKHPGIALILALCLFSLMGMPPTAGFFGKLYVFTGALSVDPRHQHQTAMIVLAVLGVLNSVVAAFYYLRIIAACYLHEPREATVLAQRGMLQFGLAICAVFIILVGLWPHELFRLSGLASNDLRPLPPVQNDSPMAVNTPEVMPDIP